MKTEPNTPIPIGPFMRAQILTRLREALDLAEADLPRHVNEFRDLVTDVLTRVDGINLPQAAGDDTAQPRSQLQCAVLSTDPGGPVTEFLLIPFGEVVVERPVAGENFVFTPSHAESAQRWFQQMGRKLAVDYEHQSFDRCNTRPDGLRPAAGWIGGLEVRDNGLWAVDVTWTERARELLSSGEYRYFSPVIFWTDEDHTSIAALGPVALTNDPAMRGVQPLAASRQLDEHEHSDAPEFPDASEALLHRELEAAQSEIELLRQKLTAQEADTFVERGMRLGKIMDSTSMDWREDYLRDPEATEQRLSRAPVLLPPGRMIALDRRGEPAPHRPRPKTTATSAGLPGQLIAEPEDLAAFDQALAAGRVITGHVKSHFAR